MAPGGGTVSIEKLLGAFTKTEAVLERKLTMKDSFILEMKKGQEENP